MISGAELRPIPLGYAGTSKNVQYYEYECSQCAKPARNTYCEPIRTEMLEMVICFTCHFWWDFERKTKVALSTIIDGRIYTPGNKTEGEFRGMAGRRFDIEYIEPSIYAGQICTTFDLWTGGSIPDRLRAKFPDTAKFLGGAKEEKVGDITCWNDSDRRQPVYPLPRNLKPTERGAR